MGSWWKNIASDSFREADAEEEEYIRAQRIFAANSMQLREKQHMEINVTVLHNLYNCDL